MIKEFTSQKRKDLYKRSLTEEQKISLMNEIIEVSSHIVFLGGAGVSTESGIPDFRSKNGLYHKKDKSFSKYRPEYLLSDSVSPSGTGSFLFLFPKESGCTGCAPK